MEKAGSFPSLGEAFWTWVRVALLSFGGPAGQIAVMHRILVVEKGWISVNLSALTIMIVAMVAIFRFKVGMIPVLLGSCLAGIAIFFITNTL